MRRPFASVVLPTLNRASTLSFALASVQSQTERSLEIMIALDGATEACRHIAVEAAREDDRIRILDLPKSPGDGAESVHRAVVESSADRIFYIDDDDLWLPDHVSRLGSFLADADVADSRVCSVDRQGGLHLGPCRGSSMRVRELLSSGRLKLIYDTHVAHRRDAYGTYSQWRSGGRHGIGVYDFLAGLAAHPQCRWASCDAVTALSIHGAARRDLSPAARAAELEVWRQRMARIDQFVESADVRFHLFRLLMAENPGETGIADYLMAHGCYDGVSQGHGRTLIALFSASPPSETEAADLAVALSEPVESGYLFEAVAFVLFEAYGQSAHERILKGVALRRGANRAARMAAYSAALSRTDLPAAKKLAREAEALGPDPVGALARWCKDLEALR